jgi:hypothetical protein
MEDVLVDNQYFREFKEFVVVMKVIGWVPWRSTLVTDGAGGFRLICPRWAKVYCALAIALSLVGNTLVTIGSFQVSRQSKYYQISALFGLYF